MTKQPVRKPTSVASVVSPTQAAPVVAAPKSTDDRMTIPVKDGKIDWDKVRASRRDELRAMLSRSGVETAASPRAELPPAINAAVVGSLYDVLAQLESLVAVRLFGCTVDQAFAALAFTDAEKTALADPTARVLNKYLPASLMEKYADECMLLLLLGTMTRGKVAALQTALVHARARPVTGPRVAPITKRDDPSTDKP